MKKETKALKRATQLFRILMVRGYTDIDSMMAEVAAVTKKEVHVVKVTHDTNMVNIVAVNLSESVAVVNAFRGDHRDVHTSLLGMKRAFPIYYPAPITWNFVAYSLVMAVYVCLGGETADIGTIMNKVSVCSKMNTAHYRVSLRGAPVGESMPRVYKVRDAYFALEVYAREHFGTDVANVYHKLEVTQVS